MGLGATGAGAVRGFGKVEVTIISELCGFVGVEVEVMVTGADKVGGPEEVGEELFKLDVLGVDGVGPKWTTYDDRSHLKEEYVAVLMINSHVTQAVLVPVLSNFLSLQSSRMNLATETYQTPTAALQPVAAQEAASCA